MKNVHLSEEQIQRYALEGLNDPAFVAHLSDCIHCQTQIRAYQLLYSHIREMEAPVLDFNAEMFIPDQLPAGKVADRLEARYLCGLLIGAIMLLIAVVTGYWSAISWLFAGVPPVAIAFGLLVLLGILTIQSIHLYQNYRKKILALHPE